MNDQAFIRTQVEDSNANQRMSVPAWNVKCSSAKEGNERPGCLRRQPFCQEMRLKLQCVCVTAVLGFSVSLKV